MKFNNTYICDWSYYFPDNLIDIKTLNQSASKSLGIDSIDIASSDEDSTTMAIECLLKLDNLEETKAFYIGSESHPYAVKPQITTIQSVLGLKNDIIGADLQFACRAGIDAVLTSAYAVEAKLINFAVGIGTDVAQAEEGDILSYSAASAASCWQLTNIKKHAKFKLNYAFSYISDTPDFYRHKYDSYPRHAGRFTGEPAYFHHLKQVLDLYLSTTHSDLSTLKRVIIHSPNTKFPLKFASLNQISMKQLQSPISVLHGNAYSANVMIQTQLITNYLRSGDKALILSYGSGAGSVALEIEKS